MTTCKDCVARVFGVCQGDFCDMERVGLVEEVERQAEALGHLLGPYVKEKQRPIWHVQCQTCSLEATYTLDPEPGTPAISGTLLETPCSGERTTTESAPLPEEVPAT